MDNDANSSLNNLVNLLKGKDELLVKEASESLNVSEEEVIEMAKILQEKDIMKIHYTVVGDIILKKSENYPKDNVDNNLASSTKDSSKSRIDDMLNDIRAKIFEKKYGRPRDKGQAALEYMIMLAISLGAFTMVLYVVSTLIASATSQIGVNSAFRAMEEIKEAADFIYVHGHPSKIQLTVYIPTNIYNISFFADKSINARLDVPPAYTDIYSVVRGK